MATRDRAEGQEGRIRTLRGQLSYEAWKSDVVGFLSISGLKGHLDGTAKKPELVNDAVSDRVYNEWTRDCDKFDAAQTTTKKVIYNSIEPDIRLNFESAFEGEAAQLWMAIKAYYERSSYTQQCRFVNDMCGRVEDYKGGVEQYNTAFKRAMEGVCQVLKVQTPQNIMDMANQTTAFSTIEAEAYVKAMPQVDKRPLKLLCWAVNKSLVAYTRAISAPMYLRGIESQYPNIASEVKASNADPRTVDVSDVMARVMEQADSRREQTYRLQPEHRGKPSHGHRGGVRSAGNTTVGAGGSGVRSPRQGAEATKPCPACERPGHSQEDCWVVHPVKAPARRKKAFQKKHEEWSGRGQAQASSSVLQEQEMSFMIQKRGSDDAQERVSMTPQAYKARKATVGTVTWLIDSGASVHATSDLSLLTDLSTTSKTVDTANGLVRCTQQGTVRLRVQNKVTGKTRVINLRETLYLPELKGNILSVARALEGGAVFRPDLCALVKQTDGEILTELQPHRKCWLMAACLATSSATTAVAQCHAPGALQVRAIVGSDLWHRRLGHAPKPSRHVPRRTPPIRPNPGGARQRRPTPADGRDCGSIGSRGPDPGTGDLQETGDSPEPLTDTDASSEIVVDYRPPKRSRRKPKHWVRVIQTMLAADMREVWTWKDIHLMKKAERQAFQAAARKKIHDRLGHDENRRESRSTREEECRTRWTRPGGNHV
jgi:hypothetical protein